MKAHKEMEKVPLFLKQKLKDIRNLNIMISIFVSMFLIATNIWTAHLAVDALGNVYVTRAIRNGCITVKYDSQGNMLWSTPLPGNAGDGRNLSPSDITLDYLGNVYIAGSIDVGTQIRPMVICVIIKYSPKGNIIWEQSYFPEAGGEEFDAIPDKIIVDKKENIYVVGLEYTWSGTTHYIIKYDKNGIRIWINRYCPYPSMEARVEAAVDFLDNIYITANCWDNYGIFKYNIDGEQLWDRKYDGGYGYDCPLTISTDKSGNVYVAGMSEDINRKYDYAIVKYDPSGNEQWVKRYNGINDGNDEAHALAIDRLQNLYVTGVEDGGKQFTTIKYDKNGTPISTIRAENKDSVNSKVILVDTSGFAYIIGCILSDRNGLDFATVKYDSNGNRLWISKYNGPGNADDIPNSLVVDNKGNVYVTGTSPGRNYPSEWVTIKYDANGRPLWIARHYHSGFGLEEDYPLYKNRITFPLQSNITPGILKLNFCLTKSSHLKILIYDILGKEKVNICDRVFTEGRHCLSVPLRESGMFFVHINLDNKLSKFFKIINIKQRIPN